MKKINVLFIMVSLFLISACKTIKQPSEIAKPIDYSDSEIASIEKNKIRDFQKDKPLYALYRSYFLDDPELKEECKKIVIEKTQNALEQKNYIEANKYYKSLQVFGYRNAQFEKTINDFLNKDVPGFTSDKSKLPKTIQDCINASVTVWVDKGMKVENGSGKMDVVIGSGFFIDRRGYVITNHHVIEASVNPKYEGYCRVYIKLLSDTETKIPAKVIGYDPLLDLALLKVEIEPEFVFSLGSSDDLNIGDKISAIGAPIGLEGTVTSGIVSAVDRNITTILSAFQIDAAVNSGNSGGPLIDQNFRVQAIVFAGMIQFQGLNFAIPVEYLKQILPYLYKGDKVSHSWIGAYGHTFKDKNKASGVELYYVMPGSVAQFSKLNKDFIIKEIDGKKVNSLKDFHLLMMNYDVSTILPCRYIDGNGDLKQTVIYFEKRPKYPVKSFFESDFIADSFIPIFGMKLQNSSTAFKNSYTIVDVIRGSIADKMNLSEMDPVTVQKVQFDYNQEGFFAQIYVKRKTKGYIDCSIVIAAPLDGFNYF
ncbi:MAG: serine protease [Treponema sp.]|nr:serine protease [Treponema sp.]